MAQQSHILTVVGARPQFIKAAVISRAVAQTPALRETIIHTGQHYDDNMSRVFFDELEIPAPGFNLGVGSGSHGAQTGEMLAQLDALYQEQKPDFVLLYGDTNSTLAGALAAAKLHIPVAHVEAGLRSFNRRMPEEVNRVLTDHVSDLLFCPTQPAVDNLLAEGITNGVSLVGDVMYDSTLFSQQKATERIERVLGPLGVQPKSYQIATVHRAENVADSAKLAAIFAAMDEISTPEAPTLLPLHPGCRRALETHGIVPGQNVRLLDPQSYLDMVALLSQARLALTDSGGLQKEAAIFDVPCVTLRDETEWVETVEAGRNCVVGAATVRIVEAAQAYLRAGIPPWTPPYGSGNAGSLICEQLVATCAR